MSRNALAMGLPWVLLLGLVVGCGRDSGEEAEVVEEATAPIAPQDLREAKLYFPAAAGGLAVEARSLPDTGSVETRVRALVEALLQGPEQEELVAPLPEGVTLASVYRMADSVVLLGFQAPEAAPPPAGGSAAEMQRVYSLVNTVVGNVPEVDRVALAWNGRQPKSFGGHLDTSRPLAPRGRLERP